MTLLFWRKWHRWIGFPAAIFLLFASCTGAILAFTEFFGDLPFGGARDVRQLIHSAGIGQVLDPSDLVDAAQTLRTAWRARAVIEKLRDRTPRLAAISDTVSDFRNFSDAIDEAITARGEVADSASELLATTRRELRLAESRLEHRIQAALADAIRRGIAQEGLLTERNGRKVIPIKADYRGQIQGIVHDVSSSGATVFLEPMAVVDAGNQVRELQLAEEREVRRVLQRLTAILGEREPQRSPRSWHWANSICFPQRFVLGGA